MSEFSSLIDLVAKQGHTHSEVVEDVKIKVLELLREKFPKTPIDAEVMLDADSGTIKIFSEDKDITPKGFSDKAESLARTHLISLLSKSQPSNIQHLGSRIPSQSYPQFNSFFRILAGLFFYGYNALFALGAGSWFIQLFPFRDYPAPKLLFSLLLFFIPVSSVVISISRKLFHSGSQLLKVFFLMEIPLLIISLIALSIPDGTNRFLWFTIFNLFLIPVVLVVNSHHLIFTFIKTMVTLVWGYLCFLFSLITPKILKEIVDNSFGAIDNYNRYNRYDFYNSYSVFDPVSFIFQLGRASLVFIFWFGVILLPFLVLYLLIRSLLKDVLNRFHGLFALIVFTFALFFSYQPSQTKYLKPLQVLSDSYSSFAQKEAAAIDLIPQKAKLKDFIDYAQNARRSYLLTKDTDIFDTKYLNDIFLTLAYPLVYQGPENTYTLQQAYNLLFATYQPSAIIQNKTVLLSSRVVTFTPSASQALAEVTIEEEYENQTSTNQEVIYEFSLYPGSVVTGLKLGPDLEFTGQIAPKGAAQRTYESQLRVNRDPALLEQIGTDTYRLRVFPIPGNRDFTTLKGKAQKVQFSYITTTSTDGFPLPIYTKLTNVYTSPATNYLGINSSTKHLPSSFDPCRDSVTNVLYSLKCDQTGIGEQKMAVLLDVSLRNKYSPIIAELKKNAVPYDLYKYNTDLSEKSSSSDLGDLTFWGESDLSKVLSKFRGEYEVVFIVSGSGKPLTNFNNYSFSLSTPVYFIHDKAPGYELEFVSRITQSGGLVTNSFENAMWHYLKKQTIKNGQYLVNQYFSIDPTQETSGILTKVTQAAKLTQLVQSSTTNILNNIAKLDELNKLAKEAGIVTPYSSLLALVNDQQQAILQNQTNQYNRYDDQPIRENFSQSTSRVMPMPLSGFGDTMMQKSAPSFGGGGMGIAGGGISNPSFAALESSYAPTLPSFGLPLLLVLPVILGLPVFLIYFLIKTLNAKRK